MYIDVDLWEHARKIWLFICSIAMLANDDEW
jgi:hypothetical protein